MSTNENLPSADIAEQGMFGGIRWWISRMDRVGMPRGTQFNGYVELPDNHPIMILGASYSVGDKFLDAHGGITYAKGNIVGFDTNHYSDSEARWPLTAVRGETINLAQQVINTNTDEKRHLARQVHNLKTQIMDASKQLENLGFDTYDLNLYL